MNMFFLKLSIFTRCISGRKAFFSCDFIKLKLKMKNRPISNSPAVQPAPALGLIPSSAEHLWQPCVVPWSPAPCPVDPKDLSLCSLLCPSSQQQQVRPAREPGGLTTDPTPLLSLHSQPHQPHPSSVAENPLWSPFPL